MKKTKLSVAILLILTLVCAVFLPGCSSTDQSAKGDSASFTQWNEGAPALTELQDYVKDVTDENSENFIPVEDRVAVFDFDGTLFCETFPIYFEWGMYADRVLNDPDYQTKATDEQKQTANDIVKAGETGNIPEDLEARHAVMNAQVYAGMSLDDYAAYVKKYLDTPAGGFDGLQRKDAFYQPMIEVVNYLQANDFTVYIVTGTDRFAVRTAIEGVLDIPERQVIGMDVNLIASGQGDTDGLEYVYKDTDKVIRGDELLIKNVKMNKVSLIAQEIGRQPVLSFGNSSGDVSMAEYVTANNPYRSEAFMVVNDDSEREHGTAEKSAKLRKTFEDAGWNIISMKDDFTTIYKGDVKVIK